jgi:transcriptional regulator with XRE-family HTH domain
MLDNEKIESIEKLVIKRLKYFRESQNISQLELSFMSGISQNMITYIETGKRVPTLKTVIKLCNALKISPCKLFEDDDEEREKAKQEIIKTIQRYM